MHELLAERDFVRALARQLLGEHDGDDVAQDAWLAAFEGRPAAVREPRAWLARIVCRLAANRRRGERRRGAREQAVAAARPSQAPSTDEILACEQVRQRVVAAVLALDEPFRGTVLARFYERLDTAAIAARDHVPEATVRSRLKRGLDRLRVQLDGEHGGRGAWAAPLALLGREPLPVPLPLGVAMTSSKKAAAVVAAVACAGLLLWSTGVFDPAAPPHAPSVPTVAGALPADAADEQPRHGAQRTASAVAAVEVPFGEPRERVPYPLADEPIDEVPVRVLDAESRQPVAGAEVLFLPFRIDFAHPSTRGDQRLHELASSEALLERFGSRVRTDAAGAATIHIPRSGGSVIASRADLHRRADIRPDRVSPGQRVPIWLDRVRWVRLRVVDEASGAPLEGALLDVSYAERNAVVARSEAGGRMFGPSDPDGTIAIPLTATQHTLRVRPWAVAPAPSQPIELPAAFERVTDVRFPGTGSITIELRTPSGELWPTPIEGGIACDAAGLRSPIAGPISWCRAGRGTYRVPHVALGLTWKVSASLDPMQGSWVSRLAAGPRSPGEDVVVVLTTATEPCTVSAILRSADGSAPPAACTWRVLQGEGDREWLRAWDRCDPDGRVGWTLEPALPAVGRLEVTGPDGMPSQVAPWRLDAASSGVHDLGALVLEAPPIVVVGRVDVVGAAVRPVRVLVELPSGADWRPWHSVNVDAAVDPSFAVRGLLRAPRVRVSVMADAHCLPGEPRVVELGARDLRLRVECGHPLRARLLAPPALAQLLHVRATRGDGAPLPPAAVDAAWDTPSPRGDGALIDFDGTASTFAWPALPAGVYRVDVLAPCVRAPLSTIDGVQVGDGAPSDPRLDPLDVRDRVRTLTVGLVPLPNGPRPVTDGGVLAFPAGAAGANDTLHGMLFDARGEARLVVATDPVDVIVAVPGFRLWRANGVTATSLQVQLEPPLAVPFRLAPRVAERLVGFRVHVELDPVPPEGEQPQICFTRPGEREPAVQTALHCLQRLADTGRGTLTDSRAAGTIAIAAPGRFAVRLAIETKAQWLHVNEAWCQWQRSPVEPSRITVGDGAIPDLVVDVEEPVLAKVADQLSRSR